ncbi:MAG: tetratricopeptide repeat protein [Desulfobacteraceae bacterium]|nr:tetratricopeptide repeat protein [Desulfobacteraceae bacterium]
MDFRQLVPQGKFSEETFKTLSPVFQGEALVKEGRYEEAETKYLEALRSFPKGSGGRFLVYNKLGVLYERLNQIDRAIKIYEKGVGEGSITPFSYQRLSCLHLDAGRPGKALEYCRRGIKSLKKANTNLFQEIYFRFLFHRLKLRGKRLSRSGKG